MNHNPGNLYLWNQVTSGDLLENLHIVMRLMSSSSKSGSLKAAASHNLSSVINSKIEQTKVSNMLASAQWKFKIANTILQYTDRNSYMHTQIKMLHAHM